MSWDTFCDNFKKAVGTAVDKINQSTDLATLQVKLSMAEKKLDDAFALLGRAAYRHFSAEESSVDEVTNAMKGVELQEKEVLNLKQQIEKLKQESAKKKTEAEKGEQTEESEQTGKQDGEEQA